MGKQRNLKSMILYIFKNLFNGTVIIFKPVNLMMLSNRDTRGSPKNKSNTQQIKLYKLSHFKNNENQVFTHFNHFC